MQPQYKRWLNIAKAGTVGGGALILAGVIKILLAWMQARAGDMKFLMFAMSMTDALRLVALGLILVIVGVIVRASVRSRAEKAGQPTQ